MKAWSWFAVPPLALAAAYTATPPLLASVAAHNAAPVAVAPVNLPVVAAEPVKAASAAKLEVDYSTFGDLASNAAAKLLKKQKALAALAAAAPAPVVPVVVGPVLQSILMTGKEGVAVVDGNMVRKGDKVGDYRVAKIEPHAVTLAITRTKSVTVGKAVKQESTEEVKELHFPEYYDVDMPAAKVKVASTPGTAAPAPEQKPNQAELEQNYKQILEKLKL